jgi:hypothetical protein
VIDDLSSFTYFSATFFQGSWSHPNVLSSFLPTRRFRFFGAASRGPVGSGMPVELIFWETGGFPPEGVSRQVLIQTLYSRIFWRVIILPNLNSMNDRLHCGVLS